MNEELAALYNSKWDRLLAEAGKLSVDAANPLLVKVDQKYIDSDTKVMIVGQETDTWCDKLNDGEHTVEKLMDVYHGYFSKRSEYTGRGFWNKKNFKYFEIKLTKHFANRDVAFIWNNISKIGNDGRGKPVDEIKDLERRYFNIFLEEFKILRPDIVIFTTGDRDLYIEHHFGNEVAFLPKLSLYDGSLESKTVNLLAEVQLPRFDAVKAIRLEHPSRRTLDKAISLHVIKNLVEEA